MSDPTVVRKAATLLLAGLLALPLQAALEPGALEAAREQAAREGRYMLVAFLGQGWSLSSQRFMDKVLEDPLFQEFSGGNLVYFPVLARRKPPLGKEETAVLQSWVIHFDIKSYPTLILVAPDGQELLRHGYRDISASDYVELLQNIIPQQGG